MPDELYPHQQAALRKLTNGKILYGGVGSGKTKVAAAYYIQREAPRDVYVITTAKKRDEFDWQQEFYEHGVGPRSGPTGVPEEVLRGLQRSAKPRLGDDDGTIHREVLEGPGGVDENSLDVLGHLEGIQPGSDNVESSSRVGGIESTSIKRSHRTGFESGNYPWVLTVDSWNNIAKYADVAGAFFIFDEQRLVGSGNWTRKFLRIAKHNHWILLSATPGDTWMDYIPVFVANNFYKNRTEFKRNHVVYNTFTKFPKVDRYINVGRLVRLRSELLVEMPYVRHTKRRHVEVQLPYDKETLDLVLKKRWHVYEDRPLRDVAEMFSVARKVVNSDPSRLEMVKELWTKHQKLIVFYNFNYELEMLRTLKSCSKDSPSLGTVLSSSVRGTDGSGSTNSTNTAENTWSSIPDSSSLKPRSDVRESNGSDVRESNGIDRWNNPTSQAMGDGSQDPPTKNGSFLNGLSLPFHTTPSRPGSPGSDHGGNTSSGTRSITEIRRQSSEESSKDTTSTSSSETSIALAEWNGHKHQAIPTTDRWLYLVQYVAGAEAWECTETDATAFYSRTYSWKVWEQAQGRMDRLNTPFRDLWYYNFTSNSFIDKAIERSLRAKENFNEAKYAGMFRG